MKTLIKAVCVVQVVFGTASFGLDQTAKYGKCSVNMGDLPLPDCAIETRNGQVFVLQKFADDVFSGRVRGIAAQVASVDGQRLAWTYLAHGEWSYFDRSGLVVVQNVAAYDNGASEFHYGLVLVTKDEKWGLANTRGKLVVPMQYDGMLDYMDDRGWLACSGCGKVHHGEHWWFSGGKWVRLGRQGRFAGEGSPPPAPAAQP